MFSLKLSSETGRRGCLETAHGKIETPFFMPVGTAGAMKGLTGEQIKELGAQIMLCNTYHLHLQPGEDIIKKAGGLHNFIGWDKPILTDSGGYQVFSFGRRGHTKVDSKGVHFQSHLNGDRLFIGPNKAINIQHKLGADIIMCFDECPPSTASKKDIQAAVDRTLKWAKECKTIHERLMNKIDPGKRSILFGIIQGGLHDDLRKKCTEELIAIDFDGYAIGGLAVGEEEQAMYEVLDSVCPLLPTDRPRYLMGVGVINQLKMCVAKGIDMFDCVLPMRIARHGSLLLSDGTEIKILNSKFKNDHSVIDEKSPSHLGAKYKKSYLHHLFKAKERLAETIATHQNLAVTLKAMADLRGKIENKRIKQATGKVCNLL